MKKLASFSFFISILFAAGCHSPADEKEEPAPVIDVKLFFKDGDKTRFDISDDGNYYTYTANYKGKMNIYVRKINDTTAIRVTNDTLRSISRYFVKNDRIIYLQDIGGDENFQLFSVKFDGSDLRALTPFPGYRSDLLDKLAFIKGKEKEILVLINKRDKEYFDPYSLNIETGALTLLYENKQNYTGWMTDNNG
ncbi:MAG TPA: S9 family peptidase, partial [Bacteroidia bacterium]|nr:S9 family peptidase [Bacteroidia bacterium]